MKRLIFVLLVFSIPAWSQTTAVTALVSDLSGTNWSNGTYTIMFVPVPGNRGPYYFSGSPFNAQVYKGALDSGGNLSITLPSNTSITPSGTLWKVTVCPLASSSCHTINVQITGTSQSLTTALSSTNPAIQFFPTPFQYGYNDAELQAMPGVGQVYYDTITGFTRQFNGTSWNNISGGGGALFTPTGIQYATSTTAATVATASQMFAAFGVQSANCFFAGPTSGSAAIPTCRAIVPLDLGTGTASSSTFLRGDLTWAVPSGSGTVSPGSGYALPAYPSGTSTTVGPTNITTDSSGNNLSVPGTATSAVSVTVGTCPLSGSGTGLGCDEYSLATLPSAGISGFTTVASDGSGMAQAIGATTFSHFCTAANYSSLCPGSGATLQVNSVNNSSQALLNDETSTTNATGLTVTPSNPSGGIVKHEITGTVNLGNMAQLFVDNPQTSTYNAVTADLLGCKTITVASGTFTIGLLATVPASGQCLQVINYGTGTITVSPNGHNLNGSSSSATIPPGSASAATGGYFHSDGTNYEGVWSGNLAGIYCALAGCTMTGTLNGTTGAFSTAVSAPTVTATTSSSVNTGSANNGFITTAKIAQNNTSVLGWENSATDATGSLDTGLSRDAAGVVDVGNGAAGNTSGTLKAATGTFGTAVTVGGNNVCQSTGTNCPSVLTNPMTTLGDTIYGGASGVPTRLAGATANGLFIPTANVTSSTAVAPTWSNFINLPLTSATAPGLAPFDSIFGNTITSATGGSGTGTVTCVTATCTNVRGSYTVAGGTFATGTLLALVWPTTITAFACSATVVNDATGASIGYHSVATATGMNITSLTAATGLTIDIDYRCSP